MDDDTYRPTTRCRECLRLREVRSATKYGGGTYRRGGRIYHSSICRECARNLLTYAQAGHEQVSRWGVFGLIHAWGFADPRPATVGIPNEPRDTYQERRRAAAAAVLDAPTTKENH